MSTEKIATTTPLDSKSEKTKLRIVWRKNIELREATLFMRIAYDEDRPDLKAFLSSTVPREQLFEGPLAKIIAKRVGNYLAAIQLLDQSGNITPAGRVVADTGKYTASEEGKYSVWYCQEDALLGNRMLYLQRDQAFPDKEPKAQHLRLPFLPGEPQYWLSTHGDKPGRSFQLKEPKNVTLMEIADRKPIVSITWEWEGTQAATIRLAQGSLKSAKNVIDLPQQIIDIPIKLQPWLATLFPQWNFDTQRLPVPFDEKLTETARRTFLKDGKYNVKGFETVQCTNIPLMPERAQDAEAWRNWLVEKELEADYVSPESYVAIFNATTAITAFASFPLQVIQPITFLSQHFASKNAIDRSAAYWHLAAAIDLNPHHLI